MLTGPSATLCRRCAVPWFGCMQLQNIHDQIMREAIAKHGGYEINTEGDSFQIAFGSVHAAMAMAMDVQYRLLEANWPENVLAQNACKVLTGEGVLVGCWGSPQSQLFTCGGVPCAGQPRCRDVGTDCRCVYCTVWLRVCVQTPSLGSCCLPGRACAWGCTGRARALWPSATTS